MRSEREMIVVVVSCTKAHARACIAAHSRALSHDYLLARTQAQKQTVRSTYLSELKKEAGNTHGIQFTGSAGDYRCA